jgi:hypothetical protein
MAIGLRFGMLGPRAPAGGVDLGLAIHRLSVTSRRGALLALLTYSQVLA